MGTHVFAEGFSIRESSVATLHCAFEKHGSVFVWSMVLDGLISLFKLQWTKSKANNSPNLFQAFHNLVQEQQLT